MLMTRVRRIVCGHVDARLPIAHCCVIPIVDAATAVVVVALWCWMCWSVLLLYLMIDCGL